MAQKYGQDQEITQASNTLYPSQEDGLSGLIVENGRTPEETFLGVVHHLLYGSVFEKQTSTYIDTPDGSIAKEKECSNQLVQHYFASHSDPQSLLLKSRQEHMNRKIIEDIVLGAQHIDKILKDNGDGAVLFVGRSGCLVQHALELLNKKYYNTERNQNIYHVSFSGTPDVDNVRANDDYRKTAQTLAKNFVTKDKLNWLMGYFDEKGLGSIQGKIYIADIIGTGGSLNSFVRILNYYYKNHLHQEQPIYEFIGINLPYRSWAESGRGLWSFDVTNKTLTFPGEKKFGVTPLSLRAHPLMLSTLTNAEILDNDLMQQYCVPGIEFPAQKWRDESREELVRGGSLWQEVYANMTPQMEKILNIHKILMNRFIDAA